MQLSPYIVGDIPIFNPCKKCLINTVCSDFCKQKILWDRENPPKSSGVRIRICRRRKKNEDKI